MANNYFNFTQPVVAGTRIVSARYNQDLAGVSAAFDALPGSDELFLSLTGYGEATGSTPNVYNVTIPVGSPLVGYVTGMQVTFLANKTSTGAAQINVNGLGNKLIVSSGSAALPSGSIITGSYYTLRFDGVNFQMQTALYALFEQSASAAIAAALAASNSATAASGSASTAANRATAAAASATAASTSAGNALVSENNAATYAANALAYRNTAQSAQTAAAGSATAAATSEGNALAFRNAAQTAASDALGYRNAAQTAATNASASATNAATSAQQAAASAVTAQQATVNKADKGVNADITDLTVLTAFNVGAARVVYLSSTTTVQNKYGVVVTTPSVAGEEASFGNEAIGVGAAVFHNFTRRSDPSEVIGNGALLGGYGARPWVAATQKYTDHSSAAIHFIATSDITSASQATLARISVTPAGANTNNRIAVATFASDGDLIVSTAYDSRSYANPWVENRGRGLVVVRSGIGNEPHFFNFGDITTSVIHRMIIAGGTDAAPTATPAGKAAFLAMSGYDGASFQGAAAAIRMNALQNFTPTNRPTEIYFETTGVASVNRTARWLIGAAGNLAPFADNVYSLGTPATRTTAVYSANGAIQTSDARLKTHVRQMTAPEVNAAKEIGKEIGFFAWLAKAAVEGENGREHVGLTVQRAMEIMTANGLDPMHYGFICHDAWEEQEVIDHYDGDGEPVKAVRPAGDRFSFRYDQLNLFIARGLEARLSEIESKL